MGTYFPFSDYVHIHTYSHLGSFLHSILCGTAAFIAMPCLDIETSRRVVFSGVFLKSASYSVLQINNRKRETIFIRIISIFSYGFQPTDRPNTKRLMEIQSPLKAPFSTPNDSTPNNRE